MRPIAVPAVVIALLLAGCASSSGGAGGSAHGTLSGRVGITGGPANPTTGKSQLQNAPAEDQTVTVEASGDRQYTAKTDSSGHYSLSLPAGTYTLKSQCSLATTVVVTAAQTTVHDISCDVP